MELTDCLRGESKTFDLPFIEYGATDYVIGVTLAAGDVKISKDGGAFTNIATLPTINGAWAKVTLSDTEMEASRIAVQIIDQTATKIFEDTGAILTTEIINKVWDEPLTGATHNVATSSGRRLRQLAGNIYDDGTAQAGGINNIKLAAGASAIDGIYFQTYLAIVAGTGAGQGHHVVGYNGTTKVATMDDDWVVQPDNTSEYILYGSGSHEAIEEGTVAGATNTTITLNSFSPGTDDAYINYHISIISGTGNRQTRRIIDYDGTAKIATIERAWDINPTSSSGYWIERAGLNVNDIWDEILTSTTHNIAKSSGKRMRGVEEYQGYVGGFIYINTTGGGTAGSESYVNGTLDNPVDNLADANILGTALSITQYKVSTGSLLTFTSAQEYRDYFGLIWTLALGGQDINGLYVHGACISGIGAALSVAPKFEHCEMNGATIPPCHMDWTALTGDMIAASAGGYFFYGCHSGVAGAGGMPSFDFNASVGTVNVNNRNYSGEFRVKNMGQSGIDACSIEGEGQIVLDADCVETSTLAWRGHFNETDNSNGTVVTRDYISDRLDAAVGATFDTNTDSLEAIRNQGDVAWLTGSGSIASVILAEKVETLLDINKPLDLSITATTRLQYQWLDINGDPVNLNGSTFKFKAVKNAGESSPAIPEITGTISDAPNGRFYFDVLPTTVFKGRYEIWAVDGASKITPLTMAGGVMIEAHPRL